MSQMDLIPGANRGLAMNPKQRKAVEHGAGPLLVLAGAGTGKTRVIIERIRTLLERDPELSGENILGLTFTDKAANEMKSRVLKSVEREPRTCGSGLSTSSVSKKSFRSTDSKIYQALEKPQPPHFLLRRNIGGAETFVSSVCRSRANS